MDLTPKQQLFIDEFIKDRNGKQAAIRAGYSERSAEVQASKMLRIGKVSDEVRRRTQEASKESGITKQTLLKELSKGAFHELDMANWRPADKLKAIEIIAKLMGLLDGKHDKDSGRDEQADAQRILDTIERVRARRDTKPPSDQGQM